MPISVVFDPPLPSDSPSTFNTKAFALLGDLNTWSTEANAMPAAISVDLSALLASGTQAGSFTSLSASQNIKTSDSYAFTWGALSSYIAGSSAGKYINNYVAAGGSFLWHIGGSLAAQITATGFAVIGGTLGYGAGAGGTVTQATSKSTAVTLNKPSGQITMHNAALAGGASVTFQFNNSEASLTDVLQAHISNPGTGGWSSYRLEVAGIPGAGSIMLRLTNYAGGSLSDAVTINFAVIKGATS